MRVLVVDDEIDLGSLWCEFLRATGHEARTASSVRAACSALRDHVFDVVVIDYRLPDGDAGDVLDALDGACPEARRMLCSGHGHHLPADIVRRADQVVSKPLRLQQLQAAIESLSEPRPRDASS